MPSFVLDGRPIGYSDTGGDKPALLFLHSFGMNGAMFAPQIEAFHDSYRCVTCDARGHGGSPASAPFTFWNNADDCLALLDHLHIERAVCVGTSQGGFTALRIALLAPSRVGGLAILGSSAVAEDPAQREAFQQVHDAFVAGGAAGPPPFVLDAMAHVCFGESFDAGGWREVWRTWRAAQFSLAFEALSSRDSILHRLGDIHTPTLVMHGTADHSYAPSHGEAIAAGVANSVGFIAVEGGAHFLSITDPEPVNAALARFLARQPLLGKHVLF